MMKVYTIRNYFKLINYNIAITRSEFDTHFTKTNETVTFTFDGWDGKSYNGESRRAKVFRTDIPGYEDVRFVKVGKGLHYIEEDHEVLEKATGEYHKRASWLVDVERV